jgi:hypothetical protein
MLTTFSGTVGGQLRQVSLYLETNLCVTLFIYQESLHDARSKNVKFWIESPQVSRRKGKWKVNMSPGTKLCAIRLVFCHRSESFENCLEKRYERAQYSCCIKSILSKRVFRTASCITRHTIFLNSVPNTHRATYSNDTVECQPLISLVTGGNIYFIVCENVV